MKTHLKWALKSLSQQQLFTFPRFEKKDHAPEAMQQLHTNDQETDEEAYASSEVHWGIKAPGFFCPSGLLDSYCCS